jgi:hypothetical protein
MLPEIKYPLNPEVITVPTTHFIRPEMCTVCSVQLHESFQWESSRPTDPMKVVYGGPMYTEMPTSEHIFCPNCKNIYAHSKTPAEKILLYLNALGDGAGFSQLVFKDSFLVSKYDTPLTYDISAGTVCYWNVTPISSKEKRITCSGIIWRIKEPWNKADGYTNSVPKFFIPSKWNREPAVTVFFKQEDMLVYPSELAKVSCKIPLRLLIFPKEFYSETETIVKT